MGFPSLASPVVQVTLLWSQLGELRRRRTMESALLLEKLTSEPSCLARSSSCLHFHCLTLCSAFYKDTTDAIIYIYTHN